MPLRDPPVEAGQDMARRPPSSQKIGRLLQHHQALYPRDLATVSAARLCARACRAWGSCLICLSFCLLSASWLPDLSFILSAVCFVAACSVVHSVCCLLPLVLYCWCCVACSVCWLLLSVSCGVCVSLGCVLLPAVSHACCSLVLPALLCARPVRRFCPRVFLVALVVLSRLHLFLACISSWSVSRRCWSVSRRISLVVCHWSSCCCAPCPVLPLEFVCSARRVRPVRLASFVLPGQFRVLPACVC